MIAAGKAFYWGVGNFAVRAASVVGCIIAAYLIRISNLQVARQTAPVEERAEVLRNKRRPTLTMWLVGIALLITVGVAYVFLYRDGLNGYNDVGPVYFFAGAIIVCAVFWGYLVSKIL
jgi:hypothetical protein